MGDQMVVKQRVLVQITNQGMKAVKCMVLPGGDLLYNPLDAVLIVPGKPLDELLPLVEHREEIQAMVTAAMTIIPTFNPLTQEASN